MNHQPYLLNLALRLAEGLEKWPTASLEKHRQFILSQQQPDGGFSGREEGSDLYYTGFAVRSLGILGGVQPAECGKISDYLRQFQIEKLSTIDLLSWLYCALITQASGGEDLLQTVPADWNSEIASSLERLRTADGGYAKSEQGALGSTYHSFLIVLIYQLIGLDLPEPNRLIQFLYDRQRDDGGFVEISPMKRSGTNPTAAAVATLNILNSMDDELKNDVQDFLKQVKSSEGGFQANTRIPFADGLSTFTGLLTAQDLELEALIDLDQVQKFMTEWLEFPTGGFRGASWDEQADVEYTFYGLGVLALLGR
ncbi:prenyltransferase/squalene oxidase repeat-containing protein [Gimesia sp.]|uniref:prenyltransferase/squalene oxidase repeat-containing protein n=1 Tax=Gimesia sp. TaxID=2024833 RepID=UPI000C66D6D1|nr:prenyltransferase/squalene oxidase repeat-containing protein [Gimesia sp.]MAX38292.1 geranyl transferase [Gimesia sp.]HAH44161.1 geranyl transferase [Planctomycetaceae bacterium]HBL44998.1 geranyl transferase [Planctomycetaceae bacterium]|tara:strand:- start:14374 stop:15306 length:933 start_codon:yes stop_codon:yes gene_type:complete